MRKRIISFTLTFLMLFLLMPTPVLGYDTTIPVYVCGIKVSDGGYWLNNGSGGITSTNADSNNYNVKYDYNTKKLTLKNANLNYSNDNTIYSATVYGGIALDIVLEGTNSVISTSAMDAAINTIYSGDIRIQGEGSLTAVGEYSGIYAFENIFIEGGTINVSGKTYGIESNRRDIYIINGNLTTSSTNSAMAKAPVLTDYEYLQITGSALKTDGTSTNTITLEELKSNLKTYKYIKFEPTVDAPKKAQVKISFSDAGGYTIKSPEFIWMKEGDKIIAPNIEGYKPFTFSSYSATFLGGITGMYNINYIGTFENPIGSATIENISFENSNLEIDIQYTEKDYEVSGIVKDSKTNTGIKASLLLKDENGAEIGETVANENGEYTFEGIKSGVYKIEVSCEDYEDGVINNVTVNKGNVINEDLKLVKTKINTQIYYINSGGYDLQDMENKEIKIGDKIIAPNIEGYIPYMFFANGLTFKDETNGINNRNVIGSIESPVNNATIESIDYDYASPYISIRYIEKEYEISGIVKDSKTNTGIKASLLLKNENGAEIGETVANENGEYTFKGIKSGVYKIEVSCEDYAEGVIENIVVTNENIVNNEIALKPEKMETTIKYVDNKGNDIKVLEKKDIKIGDKIIAPSIEGYTPYMFFAYDLTFKDGTNGMYNSNLIGSIESPVNNATIESIDYDYSSPHIVIYYIEKEYEVSGIVKDSKTNTGIKATLLLRDENGVKIGETVANENGEYTFKGIKSGVYKIEASCEDYIDRVIENIVVTNENIVNNEIALKSEKMEATIKYVDNKGNDIKVLEKKDIKVFDTVNAPNIEGYTPYMFFAYGLTFKDGTNGMHNSNLIGSIESPVNNVTIESIDYDYSSPDIVIYYIEKEYEVSGIIKDSKTNTGIKATLLLKDENGAEIGETVANENGEYTFKGIKSGVYKIEASCEDYIDRVIENIVVTNENIVNNEIALKSEKMEATIKYVDNKGNDIKVLEKKDIKIGDKIIAPSIEGYTPYMFLAYGLTFKDGTNGMHNSNLIGTIESPVNNATIESIDYDYASPYISIRYIEKEYEISGIVKDSKTNTGIKASLLLKDEYGVKIGETVANENGEYTFKGIKSGVYKIEVSCEDYIDGVIENITVNIGNVINEELKLVRAKINTQIYYVNSGGYYLKDIEDKDIKIGDKIIAPNIEGYTPYMFFAYGLTFKGGTNGMHNSNLIGTIESPVNNVTIESIDYDYSSPHIVIYYIEKDYEVSGIVKESKTNTGIKATLLLRDENGVKIGETVANENGEYTFKGIKSGVYKIEVSCEDYAEGVIENITVNKGNVINEELKLVKTKINTQIYYVNSGGYYLKDIEDKDIKIGDKIIAPNIEGYTPYMFFAYGLTFKDGTNGMYNSNLIGSIESPVNNATIESIDYDYSSPHIVIYYIEKDYEVSGIVKESKTNTGIKATLLLRDENGVKIGETVANENGEYTFKGIKSGVYKIEASCEDYIDRVIENITVNKGNVINEELKLVKTKINAQIYYFNSGGYDLQDMENKEIKIGDKIIAPNIEGYTPYMFFAYGLTFKDGTNGMHNSNLIGTIESPVNNVTIESIDYDYPSPDIVIYYIEKDYEVSGIVKDSKTNTGIKATLLLRDENGVKIGETVANENGEYTFKGIKSGVYKIEVSCEDYIDGVIENIVVTNENIVNNEIALKSEKMEATIKYVDNKGNDIKVSEKKDIKVFDTVNAPNIEGYTPYMITGYGVSFVGGSSGVDNSNSLGSKISPISIATIENIDFTYDPIMVIYYTKNTYEIMGTIKDIKTNSGIEGKLKLKDEDGNLISETVANIDGEYKFTDINPGTYKIEVSFIGYEDGVIENITVINENIVNNEITLKPDLPTDKPMQIKPEIIEGANQVILEGAEGKFRSNANINEFVKVLLDNMEVSPDNYLLKEGSIIIILKSDYIKSLDAGKHTLSIISTNGSADTEFTVAKNEDTTVVEDKKITNELKDNPKTGDNFNLFLIYSMLSLITISGVIIKKKFYNR